MKPGDWVVVGVLAAVAVSAVLAVVGSAIYSAVQTRRRPAPRHKS